MLPCKDALINVCVYKIQDCVEGAEISPKFEEIVHTDLLNLESDRDEVKENFKILILGN